MLGTDNGFTGSGLSVYGSLQQLLALGHFRPGPQQFYLNVCVYVYARACARLCACVCAFCPCPSAFGSPDYDTYDMSTDDICLTPPQKNPLVTALQLRFVAAETPSFNLSGSVQDLRLSIKAL